MTNKLKKLIEEVYQLDQKIYNLPLDAFYDHEGELILKYLIKKRKTIMNEIAQICASKKTIQNCEKCLKECIEYYNSLGENI
jgi:hypothetical protein